MLRLGIIERPTQESRVKGAPSGNRSAMQSVYCLIEVMDWGSNGDYFQGTSRTSY